MSSSVTRKCWLGTLKYLQILCFKCNLYRSAGVYCSLTTDKASNSFWELFPLTIRKQKTQWFVSSGQIQRRTGRDLPALKHQQRQALKFSNTWEKQQLEDLFPQTLHTLLCGSVAMFSAAGHSDCKAALSRWSWWLPYCDQCSGGLCGSWLSTQASSC